MLINVDAQKMENNEEACFRTYACEGWCAAWWVLIIVADPARRPELQTVFLSRKAQNLADSCSQIGITAVMWG